jgi:hypothetical protein
MAKLYVFKIAEFVSLPLVKSFTKADFIDRDGGRSGLRVIGSIDSPATID